MDYQKIYDSIISKAKSESRKKYEGVYYELHHILPKCLGGDEEKENKVLLTAREHYICHKLLHYIYPSNPKLAQAYFSMGHKMKDRRKLRLTSREYEEARIAHSLAMTGENNPFFGKGQTKDHVFKRIKNLIGRPLDPKTIQKQLETKNNKSQEEKDRINKQISESLKGDKSPMFGKELPIETKEKIRKGNLGKKRSNKTRENIKNSRLGKERSEKSRKNQSKTINENGGPWNKGKTGIFTEEALEKNRLAHLNKTQREDSIKKQWETKNNKSEEEKEATRQKRIAAQKGRPKNPLSVAKRVATNAKKREKKKLEKEILELSKLSGEARLIEEERRMMIF